MDVTCITRRRDAIFTSFLSQLAPSEATVMRQPGQRSDLPASPARPPRHHRHRACAHAHAAHRRLPRAGAAIQARHAANGSLARALCQRHVQRPAGKFVIAIDDDIDPEQCRRHPVGNDLPRQAASRHADPAAPRGRPWAARQGSRYGRFRATGECDLAAGLSRRSRCPSASTWSARA